MKLKDVLNKAKEQPCLTEHCAAMDIARGGNGVSNVYCSCPKCSPRC